MSIPVKLGILLAAAFVPVVAGATETKTRLVDCDAGSCLLVTGHRDDAASPVAINGHAVSVEGTRKWRVSLPVETVRNWSAAYARAITVSIGDPETRQIASSQVGLPIGLLYRTEHLAMLVISVK